MSETVTQETTPQVVSPPRFVRKLTVQADKFSLVFDDSSCIQGVVDYRVRENGDKEKRVQFSFIDSAGVRHDEVRDNEDTGHVELPSQFYAWPVDRFADTLDELSTTLKSMQEIVVDHLPNGIARALEAKSEEVEADAMKWALTRESVGSDEEADAYIAREGCGCVGCRDAAEARGAKRALLRILGLD